MIFLITKSCKVAETLRWIFIWEILLYFFIDLPILYQHYVSCSCWNKNKHVYWQMLFLACWTSSESLLLVCSFHFCAFFQLNCIKCRRLRFFECHQCSVRSFQLRAQTCVWVQFHVVFSFSLLGFLSSSFKFVNFKLNWTKSRNIRFI